MKPSFWYFFWNVEVTTPRLINVTCCEKSPFGFEPRATGIPCRIYNQRAIKNRYIDWESCIGLPGDINKVFLPLSSPELEESTMSIAPCQTSWWPNKIYTHLII